MRETTRLYVFFCNFEPPQMKRADLFSKRAPGQAFNSHVEAGEWVRENLPSASMLPVAFCHGWERERSFHASNPSCCLPSTRYFYKWFFCKRICQMFFLGNCRQSYILNKEYLGKNRRIFGFFQTGWEGLPPDSHFHCFLCFLNWHGQLQEDFYPFFLEIVLNPVLDTALKAKVLEQISNELPDFSCSPR